MVLIVIAVIALHRRIRTLIQHHAASQHQQGLVEHALIPRLAEPTPPTSPDTMPKPLVLQGISTLPGQSDERTDRHARLISPANWSQARSSSDRTLYSRVLRVEPINAKSAGAANDIHQHRRSLDHDDDRRRRLTETVQHARRGWFAVNHPCWPSGCSASATPSVSTPSATTGIWPGSAPLTYPPVARPSSTGRRHKERPCSAGQELRLPDPDPQREPGRHSMSRRGRTARRPVDHRTVP
jgi:hypothetical protein